MPICVQLLPKIALSEASCLVCHTGASATFQNRSRNLSAFCMTVADTSLCVEQAAGAGLHRLHVHHIMVHNRQDFSGPKGPKEPFFLHSSSSQSIFRDVRRSS